jgi:hypothetical protein
MWHEARNRQAKRSKTERNETRNKDEAILARVATLFSRGPAQRLAEEREIVVNEQLPISRSD